MPAPKLSPEAWSEIRICGESGMSDEELSETYMVSKEAIRQRRKREKWITPKALKEMAMIQEAKDKARVMNNDSVTSVTGPTAVVAIAAKLSKMKEETLLLVAEKCQELITQGFEKLTAPKGWKEMAVANTIFNNAVGVNKGGGMVIQVGGAAWQGSPQGERPKIIQIEAQEV